MQQNWHYVKLKCLVKRGKIFSLIWKLLLKIYFNLFKDCCTVNALTKTIEKFFIFPVNSERPEQKAFEYDKKAFITAIMLALFNPDLETWVKSDSSDYIFAAVSSKKHDDGISKPVAFMFQKISLTEFNYEIYEK